MTDQHPITPPPELVQQWVNGHYGGKVHRDLGGVERTLATQAARWGADQEVRACCQWLSLQGYDLVAAKFRAARRPKPPSLKEQALAVLDDASDRLDAAHENIIRRALEQLDD